MNRQLEGFHTFRFSNGLRLVLALFVASAVMACREKIDEPATAPVNSAAASGDIPEARPTGKPLPEEAFQVEWQKPTVPSAVAAGETFAVAVTFKNRSNITWPDFGMDDPAKKSRGFAVRLGCRWKAAQNGDTSEHLPTRADLPAPLAAGQSQTLQLEVTAPREPGAYRLQIDLVQEYIAWFEAKGADTLELPIVVTN